MQAIESIDMERNDNNSIPTGFDSVASDSSRQEPDRLPAKEKEIKAAKKRAAAQTEPALAKDILSGAVPPPTRTAHPASLSNLVPGIKNKMRRNKRKLEVGEALISDTQRTSLLSRRRPTLIRKLYEIESATESQVLLIIATPKKNGGIRTSVSYATDSVDSCLLRSIGSIMKLNDLVTKTKNGRLLRNRLIGSMIASKKQKKSGTPKQNGESNGDKEKPTEKEDEESSVENNNEEEEEEDDEKNALLKK